MTSLDWCDRAPDRQSPVPLYYQFAAAIRERIRAGLLTPGAQLPGERELAEHVEISRMTARQALADLARGGDVVAKHGVGTFVPAPMLLLEGITTTDSGAPLEWFQAIYRADRVKIAVKSLQEPHLAPATAPMSVMLT